MAVEAGRAIARGEGGAAGLTRRSSPHKLVGSRPNKVAPVHCYLKIRVSVVRAALAGSTTSPRCFEGQTIK
jgi:hypothetical protein